MEIKPEPKRHGFFPNTSLMEVKVSSSSSSSSSSPLTPTKNKSSRQPIRSTLIEMKDLSMRTKPFSSPSSSSSSSHLRSYSPSSVPFSWESQPGIPKTNLNKPISPGQSTSPRLPLPPPVGSNKSHTKYLKNAMIDPFAVALMECSKPEVGENWKMTNTSSSVPVKRKLQAGRIWRPRVLGLMSLDLYASCKSTISSTSSVVDSSVYLRRSGRAGPVIAYELLHRRPE